MLGVEIVRVSLGCASEAKALGLEYEWEMEHLKSQ